MELIRQVLFLLTILLKTRQVLFYTLVDCVTLSIYYSIQTGLPCCSSLRSRLYPFLDWDDSRSEFGLCKEIQRSRTLLPPPPYSNIRVLQTLSRIEKCGDSSARELANPVESVYGHQKIWVWREAHQFRSLLPSMCSSFYNLCFGRLISTSVSPDPSHLYLVLLITKYPTRRSKATNAASYLYLGPSSTDCEYTHQSLEFVGTYVTLPYVPR